MQIFTPAHHYSKNLLIATVAILGIVATTVFSSAASAEWKIDLSRRQKEMRQSDMNAGSRETTSEATTVERSPASTQPMFADGLQPDPAPPTKWPTPELPKAQTPQASNVDVSEPVNEIVIMNTAKGFVPSTIRLRRDVKYQVHVVNVNEKEKNISFVLDGFSEHQATYYGKIKSFYLQPTREGVYSFNCPETSVEGRLVVFAPPGATNLRTPASDGQGK